LSKSVTGAMEFSAFFRCRFAMNMDSGFCRNDGKWAGMAEQGRVALPGSGQGFGQTRPAGDGEILGVVA
jgi:hypothetical protein